MKALIISVILLLSVISGVVANTVYTSSVTQELTSLTLQLIDDGNDIDGKKKIYSLIKERWNCASGIFIFLYDYREIESVEILLLELESSLRLENDEELLISSRKFIHYVERLEKISKISFANIV